MKRYRVWAYDSVGYYLEIDAQNKSDAYNKDNLYINGGIRLNDIHNRGQEGQVNKNF